MLAKNGKPKTSKAYKKMVEEIHRSVGLSEEEEKVNSTFLSCVQSQSVLNKPFSFLVSCI